MESGYCEKQSEGRFYTGIYYFLGILTIILWVGYKITGALFSACVWLFIKVPCALLLGIIGLVLSVTILLIPVGGWFLKTAGKLLIPG